MSLYSKKDLLDQISQNEMTQKWVTIKKKLRILMINNYNDKKYL